MHVDINDKLYRNIADYCSINNITIKQYVNDLLRKNFMIDKYGIAPCVQTKKDNTVQLQINEVKDEEIHSPKKEEIYVEKHDNTEKSEESNANAVTGDTSQQIEQPKTKKRKLNLK